MLKFDEELLLKKVELKLKEIISHSKNGLESILWDAMAYMVLAPGKRIRPLLTLAAGYVNEAKEDSLLLLGAAIEIIHCYSLIHDDLPSMDNDDLRRGIPTCHKKYSEAVAILAGDALQALAFEVLCHDDFLIPDTNKIKIVHMIANFIGASGMALGQYIDLSSGGEFLKLEELQNMHLLKTGCLIKGSILAGYMCGENFDANIYQKLNNIGSKIGLLFQIIDDILDVTSSTEVLGKTANKDVEQNKATYVSILGLSEAKNAANKLYEDIRENLQLIPNNDWLIHLTSSIYMRNN